MGDPYYNRKQVPDELIQDVGYTGLTATEEVDSRERKYSRDGGDLRKFWNPKDKDGKLDSYYQRKQVPDSLIHDVGYTGLSKEEEFANRERKYSANGVDVRKFGDSAKAGWHPTEDPYYGRKQVNKAEIDGVGQIQDMTPAEALAVREHKTAMFDLSKDPFEQLTGSGHRASVVDANAVSVAAAAQHAGQRRRSSAVAPEHSHQHHHSGYDGDTKLAPVESRPDEPTVAPAGGTGYGTTAVRDETGHATGETGHTTFYDSATRGLDEVAPHEQQGVVR